MSRTLHCSSPLLVGLVLASLMLGGSLGALPQARAEYAVGMEPGRIAVRHAAWRAGDACLEHLPDASVRSVDLTISLDRRGRARRVEAAEDVPAFLACVTGRLRRERLPPTGADRDAAEWVVVTRYVVATPREVPPTTR